MKMADELSFDYVIVGAGSAGCVLASRLSEQPGCRVLLIEAGMDTPPDHEPAIIRDIGSMASAEVDYMWPNLLTEVRGEVAGVAAPPPKRLEQGRIMGGGSSLMGMFALRGLPSDYDEWETLGAAGWGWDDVLPYFVRLERDLDRTGEMHGKDGPVAIRRIEPDGWPPFCVAVGDALESRGFAYVSDLNGEFGDGYGPLPMSSLPHRRVTSASAYLGRAVRARPNLRILCETTLTRLLIEEKRVVGVEVDPGDRRFRAQEVILSMGALHSPAALLRSGIGPAADLARAGIDVIADRPGVGRNLQNHPRVYAAAHLRPQSRQPRANRPVSQNVIRYSSGIPDCPPGDMQLMILNRTSWHHLGNAIAALVPAVYKPFSRGAVTLRSMDPRDEPVVRFRHLSDRRDLLRLVLGLRFSLELLADPRVDALCTEKFSPRNGDWVRRLSRPTLTNRVKAVVAALMLDGPSVLRRRLIRLAGTPNSDLSVDDDDEAERLVVETFGQMCHPAGTCAIGPANDPMAVVDPHCRVYGVEGLRVVDGSVMPTLVAANTNIPIVMIAERAADLIKTDRTTLSRLCRRPAI